MCNYCLGLYYQPLKLCNEIARQITVHSVSESNNLFLTKEWRAICGQSYPEVPSFPHNRMERHLCTELLDNL